MPEFAGRHAPELARDPDVDARRLFEATAFHQAHGGIDDGLRRKAVVVARFESEDVARQMKRADLAPPIGKQLVSPNRAADDLIDVFGWLVLAVNLLVLPVRKLRRHEAGMSGQRAELVWIG